MARRDAPRAPARGRPGVREPKKRILVVTEGEVTEPDYVRGLQWHFRNTLVSVEVAKGPGVPKTVVDRALELRQQSIKAARRDSNEAFDEVWCVFDRDDHPEFSASIERASQKGLRLAVSNPCFELWLLLHFQECPGAQDRKDLARLLRTHVANYDKKVDFAKFQDAVGEAERRAKALEADKATHSEPYSNPSTGVHHLVQAIRPSP